MADDDAEAAEADAAAASAAASRAALAALRPVEGFTFPCASIPCVQTKTFPYPRHSCPVTAHLWQVGHERSQRSRRRRQLWHDLLVLGMRQTVPPRARGSFLGASCSCDDGCLRGRRCFCGRRQALWSVATDDDDRAGLL
jgi:hypothetical protein